MHGTIQVAKSCLNDTIAKNAFEYLKRVSQVNDIGKSEECGGILPSLYEGIGFIDQSLAIAPYLSPSQYHVGRMNSSGLIFPFGCNASQEKAVTAAFENQISVIQGPPGTGKTQTILNIIANILLRGKTVMVVSNNNSAAENVLEKLQKYELGFVVAPLGKRENKDSFIEKQPKIPHELFSWHINEIDVLRKKQDISRLVTSLKNVYALQEELAILKREIKDIGLEWEYFKRENQINDNTSIAIRGIKSIHILKLWLSIQAYAEKNSNDSQRFFMNLIQWFEWIRMVFVWKRMFGLNIPLNKNNLYVGIIKLQVQYFLVRTKELGIRISDIETTLRSIDADEMVCELKSNSLCLLKNSLFEKYCTAPRRTFSDVKELIQNTDEVCSQYPVILSTTFSARTAIPNKIFDYIIMDEASQVSIETGALAMTCARNAVIVGDTMQLPNVVSMADRVALDEIFKEFKVPQGYNCAENSFLLSVCSIIPNVKQTLLREHYRCHPTIINFCNNRFYGGNLLVMTDNHGERDVMMVIKTFPGHHSRNHYNQREIDVVKNEVLPIVERNYEDVGIITPYNNQVNEFNRQLSNIEAATIHKYQGREKDTIIMSVVDDQITEFSDDSNLINVAVSRAKKHFFLVVSGNNQERKGNIAELIDYIEYNNLTVSESKISSIFDYLYSRYSEERQAFLSGHKNVSEYDSENLTYSLIENILEEYPKYHHLGVLCHMPLRNVIRDWSLLNDDERKYISHYSTHLDFLIINHVTKKPVMAIETDGYTYHNGATAQHQRDLKKNHILEVYGVPLIRLSTNGSGEKEKIISKLNEIV